MEREVFSSRYKEYLFEGKKDIPKSTRCRLQREERAATGNAVKFKVSC